MSSPATDTRSVALPTPATELLARARERAHVAGLKFAGGLEPQEAWALFDAGLAHLIDVRTAEELKFVGHVPGSLHVAWQTGTALIKNPRFLRELQQKVARDDIVLFICRSGKRSAAAAEAATAAGFLHVFNVLEGFEGDLDDQQRRGEKGGWRHRELPWQQD